MAIHFYEAYDMRASITKTLLRKMAVFTLLVCLVASISSTAYASQEGEIVRSVEPYIIDNINISLDTYIIEDDYYINIHELALKLSGSRNQFSLNRGTGGQTLRIKKGTPYNAISVMQKEPPHSPTSRQSDITVIVNNKITNIISFEIRGNIYVNIIHLAEALGMLVDIVNKAEPVEELVTTIMEDGRRIREYLDASQKMIAITYDDGPVQENTNKILDILEEHNQLATFFVLGGALKSQQDTVLRAFEAGHEIANHTWSHGRLTTLSVDQIIYQVSTASNAIEAITGSPVFFMRPPFGAQDSKVRDVMKGLGLPLIMWSMDPSDYLHKETDPIIEYVMEKVKDGGILLLHDTNNVTVEATKILIPALLEEGYQLVTVSELFYFKNVTAEPGQSYGKLG